MVCEEHKHVDTSKIDVDKKKRDPRIEREIYLKKNGKKGGVAPMRRLSIQLPSQNHEIISYLPWRKNTTVFVFIPQFTCNVELLQKEKKKKTQMRCY